MRETMQTNKRFYIIIVTICFLFLLGACATDENEETIDNETLNEENEHDDLSEENGNEIVQNENNENENEEIVEKEVEEEKEPLYRVNDKWSVIPIDDANEQVVLLTIDDAPDRYAVEMAKILKELDAPAIFFVNGHFLTQEKNQKMLKDLYDLGFTIGNHTYSHKNLKDLTEEEQYEEIVSVNDLVEEIIGERPKFFRPPHGSFTDYAKEVVQKEKMVFMNWTYGYDFYEPYMDKDKLVEAMVSGKAPEIEIEYSLLNNGANLLMHDREWTKDALKDIVIGLREQGYEFVDPETIEQID